MITYIGSKKRIVETILAHIPPATNFYDLFGGGGSITYHALNYRNVFTGWEKIHYNELKPDIFNLMKWIYFDWDNAVNEIMNIYMSPVSLAEFNQIKSNYNPTNCDVKDTLKLLIYSFNLNMVRYCFNKEDEALKLPIIEKLAKAIKKHGAEYANLRDFRVNWLKSKRAYYKQFYNTGHKRNKLTSSVVIRLQSLERLETIKNILSNEKLQMSNLDYRNVPIKPDSVIYCDIPYYKSTIHYHSNFDHAEFFKWAKNNKHPVYFSNYQFETDFTCVVERQSTCLQMGNKQRTECLYWNGV